MKKDDLVLCIKSFETEYFGPTAPQAGKVYTVAHHTDECGCGYRMILTECDDSSLLARDPKWFCTCSFHTQRFGPGGWNKKFFVKVGELTLKKEEEKKTVYTSMYALKA